MNKVSKLGKSWIIAFCITGIYSAGAWAGQDVLFVASARTTLQNSTDQIKTAERGVHIIINVTTVPGTDTITPKIQGKDALGNYYDVLVGGAISTTGITVLKVYPGITAVANGAANDVIPTVYRIVITPSAASSFIYSVTANKEF